MHLGFSVKCGTKPYMYLMYTTLHVSIFDHILHYSGLCVTVYNYIPCWNHNYTITHRILLQNKMVRILNISHHKVTAHTIFLSYLFLTKFVVKRIGIMLYKYSHEMLHYKNEWNSYKWYKTITLIHDSVT